jgi:plastocyanin
MRVLAVVLLLAVASADKVTPKTVAIDGTTYQPSTLTVKVGESVTWQNKDPFPHTVTSKDAGFDSQSIAAGKSWNYKATKRGEFTYICSLHPTMKATLRVE